MAEQNRDLQKLFAEEAHERLAALLQLVEPVAATAPLSAQVVSQFCHQLHGLKGSARMVGAERLAELAHILEGELSDSATVVKRSRLEWRERIDNLHTLLESNFTDEPPVDSGAAPLAPAALALSQQRIAVEPGALDNLIHQMVEAGVAQQLLLSQLQAVSEQLPKAEYRSLKLAHQRQLVLLEAQQRQLIALRMVPINSVLPRWRELVRTVSVDLDRSVELRIDIDTSAQVDRTVLEQLVPLVEHLLRNAICHGIEPREQRSAVGKVPSGLIKVSCDCREGVLTVVVEDDGRGIDFDRLSEIAAQRGLLHGSDAQRQPLLVAALLRGGLSGASQLSAIAGRGIGLAAVASKARDLGGALHLHSEPGGGSRFALDLPISIELRRVLAVRVGDRDYLLSGRAVQRVATFASLSEGREICGEGYPLADLAKLLGSKPTQAEHSGGAVLVDCDGWRLALRVDSVGDYSEQRVESLGAPATLIPGIAGALLGDDGTPRLVLDLLDLLRAVRAGQLPLSAEQLLDH